MVYTTAIDPDKIPDYIEVIEARSKYPDRKKDWYPHQMIDSYAKNRALAEAMGVAHLKALVPGNKEELRQAFSEEQYLNTIPLKKWDRMHPFVLEARRKVRLSKDGKFSWSLSCSVSLLKHVALYDILSLTLDDVIKSRVGKHFVNVRIS